MAYDLYRTPTYEFSVGELGPLARIQLRLAEELIRGDPENLPNTIDTVLGGRRVTLLGAGDLAIYLEVRPPTRVSLYLVVDGRNLPDWYQHPTGTWFEDIDLT
jgi:hypothetical protein